ncbi:PAS domain-containing protein [Sphingomonas glacialis]|uniref:histidine kinase n=1 Tax=Sphingomonas glacialis TaxID=658225 RepID=A0A502G2U3_9SPHN|nr:PAS domain-containing protein [Sphingomonas glacialis]TPG56105.1 PAS domain S-box protein [Sphingomonas glacialis]
MAVEHPVPDLVPRSNAESISAKLRFLDGAGPTATRLRTRDWSDHPLGPPEDWPATLKLSVSLCLRARFPSAVYWGADFWLIYNDAWTGISDGDADGSKLARPVAETRPELWPMIEPHFRRTFETGEGATFSAQPVTMLRDGAPSLTYWTYNISPIQDEDGTVCGLFNQGLEVTGHVETEQALRAAKRERDFILTLVEEQRIQPAPDDVMQHTAEVLGKFLEVDRVGFFEVTPDDLLKYGACWVSGRLSALTGTMPTVMFGKMVGTMVQLGNTLAFSAPDDPDAPPQAVLGATGTKAGMSVPLVRGGTLQAALYISHAEPRAWTRGEIALVEEVAELSWDAVARVRAVTELRALNAELASKVAARTAERDQLWEFSTDLLGIAERDGRWISVNPAWERLLGWASEDIIGRDSQWLRHPDDAGGNAAEIARIAASGTTHRLEKRLRTRDGGYRTFAWQTILVGDRIYTNARDITEERRQEAALRAADARTRIVLDAMEGVGVWTYDVVRDRFDSEIGFAELYGFTPEQMQAGVSLCDVAGRIHPEDRPILDAAIELARKTGQDGAHEYRLLLPDGSVRWVMARNHVQHDAAGRPETVVGVGVDVSRQRELEERLRQAHKMEAVGQLTGGLAHDFNNLLMGISGALELMQLRVRQGRSDDLPRYLDAAQAGTVRAAALTHRLLAFSRRQPLDPRPVHVPQLIAGVEDLVRGTLGPSITLETAIDADSWSVLADANQLENAVLNLCINARDASPAGGTVRITTHNETFDPAAAALRDLVPGAYLVLCVADSGTGMSPEVIARAFDPFFTTKPTGQGTGLGLSMIYGFVRQSGGQVQIDSRLGEGTTMCLYLPRHDGAVGDGAPAQAGPMLGGAQRGETVLVVDDEPSVRMLVSEVLGDLGYVALEAATGAAALELLRSAERIDLLVTDVGLPGGLNGRQVADAARVARPMLPVLFITGFAENAVVGDSALEPGMALLAKPFAIETLAQRIRAMLGG